MKTAHLACRHMLAHACMPQHQGWGCIALGRQPLEASSDHIQGGVQTGHASARRERMLELGGHAAGAPG
jgi:hypothetical protein